MIHDIDWTNVPYVLITTIIISFLYAYPKFIIFRGLSKRGYVRPPESWIFGFFLSYVFVVLARIFILPGLSVWIWLLAAPLFWFGRENDLWETYEHGKWWWLKEQPPKSRFFTDRGFYRGLALLLGIILFSVVLASIR